MKREDAYQLNLINNDFQDDYLEISIELLMELINKNITGGIYYECNYKRSKKIC